MSKHIIVKNLNNTYSVKTFSGKYYKLWTNPLTNKQLVFVDKDIAEYWTALSTNCIDYSTISGIIDYYI